MLLLKQCFFEESTSQQRLAPRLKSWLRPSLGRIGLVGIVLCLGLGAFSRPAAATELAELRFDTRPDWEQPVTYSAEVMGLGLGGLVAFDLHDADPAYENFLQALRSPAPRPDDDGAVFNYVLHPLWGSETYLRARNADFTAAGSFAFSMGASVTWEYLIESWTEHPSRQDLVYTTGLGWMLGEARYQLLQRAEGRQVFMLDPLYATLQHVDLGTTSAEHGYHPRLSLTWHI
jgi:hypothetical protein